MTSAPTAAPVAQSGGFNFGAGFPDTANANGTWTKFSNESKMDDLFSFHVYLPSAVGASFFGDMLQPQGTAGVNGAGGGGGVLEGGAKAKLVSGDLDASLANLTTNLNLASGANK